MEDEKEVKQEDSNITKVKKMMLDFVDHIKNNSLMDTEKVEIDVDLQNKNKASTIHYECTDGSFQVKYNPRKNTAMATVNFVTGNFKSTVTEDRIKTSGADPVYHDRWGILRHAFTQQED